MHFAIEPLIWSTILFFHIVILTGPLFSLSVFILVYHGVLYGDVMSL